MQRRKRNIPLQARKYVFVDQNRPVIVRAAMNDAMTDRDKLYAGVWRSHSAATAIAAGTSATSVAAYDSSTRGDPSDASARRRGRAPIPSTCPFNRRRGARVRNSRRSETDTRGARIDHQNRDPCGSRGCDACGFATRRGIKHGGGTRRHAAANGVGTRCKHDGHARTEYQPGEVRF